ncbi:fused MFS/spermidine synthase [Pandoraea commovens]|uniref:Fused MFS/spermidine synthase n=2 Tax=Pandoraea commovens TaxID=2508289 RepID=A0ABY5QMG5_9BURK|nr:fused MFS/spermidine synthase [Pandoraea commovens]UVA81859.1 fused MFS/spermidine synthase [Pandoraea commovens]
MRDMTDTLASPSIPAPRGRRKVASPSASPALALPDSPAVPTSMPAPSLAWPALLLVLSGASALVFQMIWIRQLSLVVGVEVHAVSIAISAFFGGLAVGGWYFGRRADGVANPMRLYAVLEAAVALTAIVSTLVLARAAAPFAWLEAHVGLAAWVLPFVLVGVPAVFMGGTLPVLMRSRGAIDGYVGHAGARLYAANTVGAVVGVLAVPFWLIPSFGMQGAACAAAGLNVLLALAAVVASRRASATMPLAVAQVETHADTSDAATALARRRGTLAIGLYAVAGGVALGYEVMWSQAIVQFVSTRAFAFAIVLATYLCGLTLGSTLVARRVERSRDPWGVFALLVAGAGVVAAVTLYGLGDWIFVAQGKLASMVYATTQSATLAMCARFLVAGLGIVFLPTLLLGAAFPYVLRLAVDAGYVGQGVGRVVALNTAGGIVGSLATGFWLVPSFGLVRTLGVLAGIACIVALVAVWRGAGVGKVARIAVVGLAVVLGVATVATPPQRLATLLTDARGGELTFYEEGRGATVAVLRQSTGSNRFERLYIQGVSNSGDAMTSLRYMRLQALLPLIVAKAQPQSALVIGLGTGITAGALLQYPGLTHRVTAELLPAVVKASSHFKGNYGVADDKRMDIRVRDGRRELLRSADRYDLITLEPPPPSAAGVANLYSTDFYKLASSRLSDGGVVAQWLPLPTQNEAETKALIASFIAVFPHASLWTTELHEMLLVGGQSPLVLDAASIRQRFAQPGVAQSLREVGIDSPGALLATWMTDRSGLAYYVEDAAPVTDDHPRIEYAPWVGRQAFAPTLRNLLALQSEPPVTGADEALTAEIARSRQALLAFYGASLAALDGDRNTWARQLGTALQLEADNPYFRWFAGQR